MLNGNKSQHSNGLQIGIDWLSFTLTEPCSSETAVSMLGYNLVDFQLLPRGLNGYRSQLRHSVYPVSIQFDGQEGMGVHVDISGSAIQDVLDHYRRKRSGSTPFGYDAYETCSFDSTVMSDLLSCIRSNGHITRLDLAVDDLGAEFFTLPELSGILASDGFVSRFRKWKELIKRQNGSVCIGHTIYLGSRSSAIMLRVYDKQLEQNEKLLKSGESPILQPWVRWELELKEERAQQTADLLISGLSLNDVTFGILSNYLRLIQRDNARKDRCSTLPKWELFIDGIKRLALYCPSEPKTLDDTRNWLMKQTASSLAAVVIADGGTTDFVYRLLDSGTQRLTNHHRDMIQQAMED